MMIGTMRRAGLMAGAMTMMLAASNAQAATPIDVSRYNVITFGSFSSNSDVEGRLAVGGSAALTNFGTAQRMGTVPDSDYTLLVGGSLSYNGGQLFTGSGLVGGAAAVGQNVGRGNFITTGNVAGLIDFAAEKSRFVSTASSLGQLANTGTVQYSGGYQLTGTQSGLNVFNISAAQLAAGTYFNISAPTGSQVVVNIAGTAASYQNAGFSLSGGVASGNVLLNFYDASTLLLSGIGINASVLAPKAAVTFGNGQINGLTIANSIQGGQFNTGQFNTVGGTYTTYTGTLLAPPPPVPEPATWAMMIAGFGLTGAAMRRRVRIAYA